ncbi:hypothetical protein BKA69DRAFT_1051065 [Paraphysoderma sedebokerense]|nr:hypothetical protein BKA69DRAFT_1051065 [Paraphysoderma sedebokerense]
MFLTPRLTSTIRPTLHSATSTVAHRSFLSIPFPTPHPKEYSERKLLRFSQNQLYEIISNVKDYPAFVPFCTHSRILSSHSTGSSLTDQKTLSTNLKPHNAVSPHPTLRKMIMRAELGVGFGSFKESYTSIVTCEKPYRVQARSADSSMFRNMTTTWTITPAIPTHVPLPSSISKENYPSCYVDFHIKFEFKSVLHASVANVFFDQVSKATISAFEKRAEVIYSGLQNYPRQIKRS